MKDIRIHDLEFGHSKSVSAGNVPKHINWLREGPDTETTFFTDRCLEEAVKSEAKRKIAWLIEPRHLLNMVLLGHQFDYILTYYRALITVNPKHILFYPFGGCWVEPGILGPKTANVSMIASAKTGGEGYDLRHQIVEKVKGIDFFGQIVGQPVARKETALVPYRFSVVVENCFLDDWFTEKLVDCCACGTIPFYKGTRNSQSHFYHTGIIPFGSIEELQDKLDRFANPEYYNDHIEVVRANVHEAEKYRCTEDWLVREYPFLFQ